jgi:outer membrane receptor protein involved in Fe transport
MHKTIGALTFLLLCAGYALAQIQIGTINGVVVDPNAARVTHARIKLNNHLGGYSAEQQTDDKGEFTFNNLPFAAYTIRIEAAGFQTEERDFIVRSNIPLKLEVKLKIEAATATSVEVQHRLVESDSTGSVVALAENFIRRTPGATSSLNMQRLIATTTGWMTENNGLLHIRGVDDGILYVIDGIPTVDRLDAVSASNFDTDMIRSLTILTGNIPAEFGGRSGAVVQIQPRSGIDMPFIASLGANHGSFNAGEVDASGGGNFRRQFGVFVSSSATRSNRFLDPVDPGNFNNRGGTLKLNARADWHPTSRDILLFNASGNGTDFRVPNREEQEEAGQRQRQELRDNSQSASWQRAWDANTASNFAWYRRDYQTKLLGSEFDTPIFAQQDRHHTRQGLIFNLTHLRKGHSLKFGVEATRLKPREFFTFAVTDEEEAEELEISEAALQFDRNNPFVFRERRGGSYVAWYAQDGFELFNNLTVNLGLRYDRSTLPVTDHQLSPRLGVVYYLPKTLTSLRASFNRLFMPPQIENLLLAGSEEARRLSPFNEESHGGAPISPEKMSAYEVGAAQDVFGLFKFDLAFWHRNFRNFDDPNVFFNTTIIFPNSVAKGFARGLEARIDVPPRRGWSGYLSYTNARVLQTGPINGGLFLTDEFIEIGDGTRFIPDHDQRNVGAFGVMYTKRLGRFGDWWFSVSGRHESGVPLEVDEERLEELRSLPGSDLVDFERRRVKPWTVFDFSTGFDWLKTERVRVSIQFDVQNLSDRRFAYNFGNPFEGTHFGHPRLVSGKLKFDFR